MRTESSRRSFVPILLAFVMVIALVFVVTPVSAGGVTSTPGGTTIPVTPGDVFFLRHEFYFDDPAKGGYFTIAITWNCPSSDENFTLENAPSVYWISGPENGSPVENVISYDQFTTVGGEPGWQVVVQIPSENKVWVDGHFNVDIWLRAASEGAPHKPGLFENVLDYGLGIMVVETGLGVTPVSPVSIYVPGRGVDVSISPDSQSGTPCTTLNYMVTVKNTGNISDHYNLIVSDSKNWAPTLDNNSLLVPGNEDRTTILRVHIPEDAGADAEDKITVTATSQENTEISDNDSCIAHVELADKLPDELPERGVKVTVEPKYQGGMPGDNLIYNVGVTNTGNAADSYDLTVIDDLGWSLSLADNSLKNVAPGENRTITLTVTIPKDATPDTEDNITVTATSREDDAITASASCLGRALLFRVEITILPDYQSGSPGDTLYYTVTVTNTWTENDNYVLTVFDDENWGLMLSDNLLEVPAGENENVTLSVTIPWGAEPDTEDNITVTATSREDDAITASASCLGRALLLRVEITILPDYQSGSPGGTLYYTVTVTSTGQAADNYNLITSASAGWFPDIEPSSLTLDPGESDNATLSVIVPSSVSEGEMGIMEVRAISTTDPRVEDHDTCRAVVEPAEEGGKLSISWVQIVLIAALIAGAVFAAGYLTRRRGRGRRATSWGSEPSF